MVSVVSAVTSVGGVGGRVVRVRMRLLGGQLKHGSKYGYQCHFRKSGRKLMRRIPQNSILFFKELEIVG